MKTRNTNLELLRIISMCGIVIMHYTGMGGAVQNNIFPHFSWFLTHFLNSFCIPLVNCFVLITGYFLIEKTTFSLKKPIELLVMTAFYGLLAYVIWVCTENGFLSLRGGLNAAFPFIVGKRWFVETYIILILLAPFMNKLLRSLRQQDYQLLLSIQLALFCVWYSLGLSAPLLDDGYGIINFLTLYMLGGYIRLYGAERKWLNLRKRCYGLIFAACSLITFVLSYFINPFGYAFVTNVVGSVVIFLCFLKWDLGVRPGINCVSAVAFDVYFVHSDFNTSYLLFSGLLGARFVADTPWMIPHLLLVIPAVWVLGFITHAFRKRLFAITVDRWLNSVGWIARSYEI